MPTNKLSEVLLKRVNELEITLSEVLAEVSSLPTPKDGLSIKGDKGERGERGRDGKDGKSIRGADGKDGKDGRDGVSIKGDKGDDGLSAYEIWLNNGNKGTERQFLASLKGEKGEDGKFLLREVQTVHGGGGGSAQNVLNKVSKKQFDNTVVVKQPSDLASIDSTKNYMIDGAIDMGSTPIIVPPTGLSLSGLNGARDTAILYSSADNYTMFVSPDGFYSGNVVLESCTIDVTGTNSQVFNLDNQENGGAIDITGINIGRFSTDGVTSLGHLSNYRQLLTDNIGYIKIQDGLTFNGAWTGIAVTTAIALELPAMTLFKEGTDFTIDNIRSDINFLSVNAAAILFDFVEANITSKGGFSLTNVRTNTTDAVPNISGSSSYARFRNCDGIRNTYIGGQWAISTETATLLSGVTAGTPLKLAGATTYTDLQWFTQTTNNAFVYDGDQVIEVEVKGALSLSGTNGDEIKMYIRQWDDSASGYIDLSESGAVTMNSAGRAENVTIFGYGRLSNNDRIEVWIENDTAARSVTALLDGIISITERNS